MAASCFAVVFGRRMIFNAILLLFTIASVGGQPEQTADRKTYTMIYSDIIGHFACVRRMNATHQIGCSSEFNGNTGVIQLIEDDTDIDWLIESGQHAPYITVFAAEMFTRPNIEKLLKSLKVSGMVINHTNQTRRDFIDESEGYSSDRSCPNVGYGRYPGTGYANCSWNRYGDATNFDFDFGVPVFVLVYESELNIIKDCYYKYNYHNDSTSVTYPLCSMELRDFMDGVKDTPTCMWRTERITNLDTSSYCDPIGDNNVWGFAKNSNDTARNSSYHSFIVAATQIDVANLFYSVYPRVGSESVVSSLAPLLAAAEAIGNIGKKEKDSWIHDVMFTFFNGESYDYIGSSRMAFDMVRGYFPHNPERDSKNKKMLPQMDVTDIAYFLELRQLGLAEGGTYYAHVDPISQKDESVHNKTEELIIALQDGSITVNGVPDTPLPPASFQQFLKTEMIPGVVLTDHEGEFKNKFYNSRYDIPYFVGIDVDNWNNESEIVPLAMELNKVANTVAKTLVSIAGGDASSVTTDVKTVNQLLYCFLVNQNCSLFRSLQGTTDVKISNVGVDLYTGVEYVDTQGGLATSLLLAYYLGEKTPINKTDKSKECSQPDDDKIFSYSYFVGPEMEDDKGICVKSTVHQTVAVSPAFISDKDTKPDWASTKYSTWTESQWAGSAQQIRVFLIPSPQQEWVIFSLGLLTVLISFPSVYFIKSRADIIFRTDTNF